VAVGGTVFAAELTPDGGRIVARDAGTGVVQWESPPSVDQLSGPAVSGGVVYATSSHFGTTATSALHAYDASTGAARFTATIADCTFVTSLTAPTVGDGLVLVTDASGVCALDATTGAKVWTAPLPLAFGAPALAGGRVFATRQVDNTTVTVVALDAGTGAIDWSRTFTGSLQGAPVVAGNRLFVPAGVLATFDVATGTPGWTSQAFDVSVLGDVAVADGPGDIRALDANTGALRWSIVGPAGTVYSKPALANGLAYVGSYVETGGRSPSFCCAHLAALDLGNGGQRFSMSTQLAPGVESPTSAIVANGSVFVDVARQVVTALQLPR
jgi:outer membrane protein assembly factor BamB